MEELTSEKQMQADEINDILSATENDEKKLSAKDRIKRRISQLRGKIRTAAGKLLDKLGYNRKEKTFNIGKVRIKKKLVIIVLIIIAIILLFMGCSAHSRNKMLQAMQPKDVIAERRTIEQKVTGSSVIEPKDSYSIMTITTGEITADYINEGDTVEKGDKLYQFDSETPQNSVDSAENALKRAQQSYADAVKAKTQTTKTNDKNVQSAQIGVERARQSYNDALKTLNDLNIRADISGTVSEVFVKNGDSIQNGGKIASVYSDKYMKIRVPFNETDAESISVGDGAVLTVVGTGNELWGSVSEVSTSSVATSSHNIVRYVTVEVENPGALTSSDKATAQIGDMACNDAGQFEYINEHTICAEATGKIASVSISAGDSVYDGQAVAVIDSDSARSAANTAKLSLDDATLTLEKAVLQSDAYSQDSAIITASLALDDARLGLEKAQKGLNDYTITAPIAGTVVTKNSKAGDKIDSSNATTPMCIIYDMSSVQFDINVDEIDVAKIKVGQEVTVTADAVSDKIFKGVVEKVSVNGVVANGVTNYPVTVSIADYGELLPGMNIDAEIVVEKADNVLAVPVSSLVRGNIVYVKGDKENDDDKAPDGYRSVEVTTGISDDNYIEIKSGINENDTVRGEELDLSSDFEKIMMQQMSGGSGGNGGPPQSGDRDGGGPGGGR